MEKEDYEKTALELATKYNVKVIPVVFSDGKEDVVCYLQEISRTAKLRILDSAMTGGFTACESLVDHCLLKEADYQKVLNNDDYYIGVVMEINNMVKAAVNQFKKK